MGRAETDRLVDRCAVLLRRHQPEAGAKRDQQRAEMDCGTHTNLPKVPIEEAIGRSLLQS